MLLSIRPVSPAASSNAKTVFAFSAALVTAETVAWSVGDFAGAVAYGLGLVLLINVAVLARLWDERTNWRLALVGALAFLDRLLVLCTPPLQWGSSDVSALWALPLLAAAFVLERVLNLPRPPARPHVEAFQSRIGPVRYPVFILLTLIAALGLGAIAGTSAEARMTDVPVPLVVLALIVAAHCAQEWVYRRVAQPVAVFVLGPRWGVLSTSMLVALTSIAALSAVAPLAFGVALPAAAAALLFGVASLNDRPLSGAVLGRAVFAFAFAALAL